MGTLRSWEVEQLAKCTPGERDSRDSVARPASIQSAPDPHAEGVAASSAARPRLREASVLAARTAPGHRRSREAPDRDARRADDFSAGHGIRQWGGGGYLGFGPQVFLIPQSVLLTSGPHRLSLAPEVPTTPGYGICRIMPCFKYGLFFSSKGETISAGSGLGCGTSLAEGLERVRTSKPHFPPL